MKLFRAFLYGCLVWCMVDCMISLWGGDPYWAKFGASEALVIAIIAMFVEFIEETEPR